MWGRAKLQSLISVALSSWSGSTFTAYVLYFFLSFHDENKSMMRRTITRSKIEWERYFSGIGNSRVQRETRVLINNTMLRHSPFLGFTCFNGSVVGLVRHVACSCCHPDDVLKN
jgi:hypothetical protein